MFDRFADVKSIMTGEVKSVSPLKSMDEVARIFREEGIHHVPVVEDGRAIGMISSTDLHKLEHHFTLFKTKNAESINQSILRSMLARDVMTSPVATIRMDDPLDKAATIFRENLFRALPVVNADGRLVGILTSYDLMNYAFWPEEVISSSTDS